MQLTDLAAEVVALSDERPISRAYHPRYPRAVRHQAADYLRDKGCELRPSYAALAIACFLNDRVARAAVCGADIRALFPRRQDGIAGPLRNPHDLLRRAAERQLLDALGDGWYRITTLGRDVVDALPDDARVAELRGCRRTIVGMRRRARSG